MSTALMTHATGGLDRPELVRTACEAAEAETPRWQRDRPELIRAWALREISLIDFWRGCLALHEDADALEREAIELRRGYYVSWAAMAALDVMRSPTPRAVERLVDSAGTAALNGFGSDVVGVLEDVAPGFSELSGLTRCIRVFEDGLGAPRSAARKCDRHGQPTAVIALMRRGRARSSIGVRSSSGQRRTRNANGAPGGGDDGPQVGEPAPPRARLRFHLAPALIGGAA